jgi:uncharacterized protein (DUF2164 family)
MFRKASTIKAGADVSRIELDKQAREAAGKLMLRHLKDEHEVELTPFDALALVDFVTETLGPYFYNQGIQDAQAVVQKSADTIVDALYQLEKPLKR